ncbi:hypothetical protein ASG40_19425 [Methylobacterium sp. Leaf399]|uniref:hypothetical protein n=1 Tax=Methylobacterium sp. Leaf399 TaxID=1736364 RepID=UPI0006F59B3A|nr:hypothetical protein [Methylobacterium sp. Leaf399]KQT13999.1 hypothetical protein ASG40_19425 [Methylobacterium sp. Leaf399]
MAQTRIPINYPTNTGLLVIPDYRTLITTNPLFKNGWNIDDLSSLTLVDGKASQINSWKPGGNPLLQANAAKRATLVYDDVLRRNVLQFAKADIASYTAQTDVFDPNAVFTFVSVVKFDDLSGSQQVCGQYNTGNNRAQIQTASNSLRLIYGDNFVGVNIVAGQYYRVIASIGTDYSPKIKVGNTLVLGTPTVNRPSSAVINKFEMGGPIIAFGGRQALNLWYNADLLAAGNAASLATLEGYLTQRGM